MSSSKFLDFDGLTAYNTEAIKKLDPHIVVLGTYYIDSDTLVTINEPVYTGNHDIYKYITNVVYTDPGLLTKHKDARTFLKNDTVVFKETSDSPEGLLYQCTEIIPATDEKNPTPAGCTLVSIGGGGGDEWESTAADTDVTAQVGNLNEGLTKKLLFDSLPNGTLSELMDYIIFPDNNPTIVLPSASLSFTGTLPDTYLVGTRNYPQSVTLTVKDGTVNSWKAITWAETGTYTITGDKQTESTNYNGQITKGNVNLTSNGTTISPIPTNGIIPAGTHVYSSSASAKRGNVLPVKTKTGTVYSTPYMGGSIPVTNKTIKMVFPYIIGVSSNNNKDSLIALINSVTVLNTDVTINKPTKTKKESGATENKYLYVGIPSGSLTFKDAAGNLLTAVTKYSDCSITINNTSTDDYIIYVTNNLVDTNNVQYSLS